MVKYKFSEDGSVLTIYDSYGFPEDAQPNQVHPRKEEDLRADGQIPEKGVGDSQCPLWPPLQAEPDEGL